MELYFSYLSTYSQKVLLGLYHKGLPFNGHPIDISDPQAHQAYKELYPFGKVPLLLTDDGRMIPESSIILEFLDNQYPDQPALIPKDPELARKARMLDRMCDLYLNDTLVDLVMESYKPAPEQDRGLLANASEKIGMMYRLLDEQLKASSLLAGEDFSLADCAAAPCLFYARSFAPFDELERLDHYWEKLMQWPAFVRLQQDTQSSAQSEASEPQTVE